MSDFKTVPRGPLEKLEAVKAERDALAAHVERLRTAGEQAVNGFSLHGLGDIYEAADMHTVLQETPATSLARLKAQWQAEALEGLAQANSRDLIHPQIVMDLAAELRRQAEEAR